MKKVLVTLLLIISIGYADSAAFAGELNVGADLMSRYIWRGRDYGNSFSIQPSLEYSYSGFTVGSWGAFSINEDVYQEHDIYVSYTIEEIFTVGVTDYFFPQFPIDNPAFSNKYFDYDEATTGHFFEANLGFAGTESFPISISANIFFYGADKKPKDDQTDTENPEMENAYSTYIEIGYAGKLNEVEYNVFLGFTPNDGQSLYAEKAGIVNLGVTAVKNVKFSESFSLPVSGSFITNPAQENIYFVFGISL
jgi:hypothetical protein